MVGNSIVDLGHVDCERFPEIPATYVKTIVATNLRHNSSGYMLYSIHIAKPISNVPSDPMIL